jgi:hypothetical protein
MPGTASLDAPNVDPLRYILSKHRIE